MKREVSIFILILVLAICTVPQQDAQALAPPAGHISYTYKAPRDFLWWLYDKKDAGHIQDKFIRAYRDEQGYLLVPEITGAVLDGVYWSYENVSVCYRFHKGDVSWGIYVYPIKDCKEESYYSDDIVELTKNRDYFGELNKKYEYTCTPSYPQRPYYRTSYFFKRKLPLGNHTTVDCVQGNFYRKLLDLDTEIISVDLHFFVAGMYVNVNGYVSALGQEDMVVDALKTCTFEKLSTNPKLTLDKKKNKISKKNAILHAILQNPTNHDFNYVELWLYDKKEKRYRRFLRKKVSESSMRKEKVALTFNAQKIIKYWRKQSAKRNQSSFPLKRKKKYKYKVRTKVYGKYLEAKGSFKLK